MKVNEFSNIHIANTIAISDAKIGSDAMWVTELNGDGCDEDDDGDENERPGLATSLIIIRFITPLTVPFHPDCITTQKSSFSR